MMPKYALQDLKVGGKITVTGTLATIFPDRNELWVDIGAPVYGHRFNINDVVDYSPPPKKPWVIGHPLKAISNVHTQPATLIGVDGDTIWIKWFDGSRSSTHASLWEHT